MRILIDGDSCNVIKKTVNRAKEKHIEVHVFCDTQHEIHNDYATIHFIDAGPDAVDFAIVNMVQPGDIVITNDGGLASMVKTKQGKPQKCSGAYYTDADIEEALMLRYFRNASWKRNKTKNMKTRHQKKKQKTIYIKECWA